jgi:hypothetical protein
MQSALSAATPFPPDAVSALGTYPVLATRADADGDALPACRMPFVCVSGARFPAGTFPGAVPSVDIAMLLSGFNRFIGCAALELLRVMIAQLWSSRLR